jgi:predicted DNA-binding antitoxin AbrB/MazE fold protein
MQVVRAIYDGYDIKPIEPINIKTKTEVLVIFPNNSEQMNPSEARRLLKGRGKGENLIGKLLKSRAEDLGHESG